MVNGDRAVAVVVLHVFEARNIVELLLAALQLGLVLVSNEDFGRFGC